MDYISEDYEPEEEELVAEYQVKPSTDCSLEEAAGAIAKESSIGTWTIIKTMSPKISQRLKPHVFKIQRENRRGTVKIAYSPELFEPGNMSQILSSIAGNIFGMKLLEDLRLQDIDFPDEFIRSFMGPQLGMEGVRDLLGVDDRPLLGTIVKPKLGLTSEKHAEVAYKAWSGGLDLVKDDENLTSMPYNPYRRRVEKTMEARKKAERETGDRKEYMPNITAPLEKMKERADYAIDQGCNYLMIDIISCGWSAFQQMRNYLEGKEIAIHCHRAGHAAFTRKSNHGISMLTVAKITRLIGGDQLHIGTADVGKMEGKKDEVLEIENEIESEEIEAHKDILSEDWLDKKRTFSVASGGLHPGSIPELLDRMGDDIVAQFGGGCHGHPSGTVAGAKAIRQALEAYLQRKDLRDYSEEHKELAEALDKWGITFTR